MAKEHTHLFLRLSDAVEFRIIGPAAPLRRAMPSNSLVRLWTKPKSGYWELESQGNATSVGTLRVPPFLFEQTNYHLELMTSSELDAKGVCLRLRGYDLLGRGRSAGGKIIWFVPLNFRSEIGYTDIDLEIGGERWFRLRVEVFPSKLDYRSDLADLRADIQTEVRALIFALQSRTFQVGRRRNQGQQVEIEWLTMLQHNFDRLQQAMDVIMCQPVRKIIRETEIVRGNKPCRADRTSVAFLRTHPHECHPTANGSINVNGQRWAASKLSAVRKNLTIETPENSFVAAALRLVLNRVKRDRQQFSEAPSGERYKLWITFLSNVEKKARRWLDSSFLAELSRDIALPRPTLALHLTPGYREFFAAYIELSSALEVSGGPLELAEKELSTLYELWCFIALANILRKELNLHPRPPTWLRVEQRRAVLELVKGRTSVIELESDGEELLRVTYNRQDDTPTGTCRPDNTLEIIKRGLKNPFRYVFDAKYRLQDDPDYVKNHGAPGPPPDTIHRMHAYRDQIVAEQLRSVGGPSAGATVWDLGYRRYVQQTVGAFVLYPYANADANQNRFFKSIAEVGVGGLPFLPSRRDEVTRLLQHIIETSAESVEDTAIELSTVEERMRIEQAHEFGLLAIVSSRDQLDYIIKQRIYHMPYVAQRALRLRADFIVFLLSKAAFGDSCGAAYKARISTLHFGLRSEIRPSPPPSRRSVDETDRYIWFELEEVMPINPPLSYDGQPPRFAFTTRIAFNSAKEVSELLLLREPERRFFEECRRAGFGIQAYEVPSGSTQVFDVADLRLRFRVILPVKGGTANSALDVKFDPVTTEFQFGINQVFKWSEFMFQPDRCLAAIRVAANPRL